MNESILLTDKHILLCLDVDKAHQNEYNFIIENFCGRVILILMISILHHQIQ